ncbi:acyl-CoA synthetase (AMP-forming)/AMP-acid ligase II [Tamaricihabitans halophyticus]|uniref:Acyl-CoA synthetase (AMP-forming)/AMP-acid ligase II n=1 Tax=Tamaricihabitans halophyticus TaxID=1262583 RepID=A0A4R2QJ27_9PSEU|nr:AMP-binding protein [Tamaricihabitans halophyticus]TCP49373.1 acyl-CoA synthetase (AMP-forming)/AMP-acid ligase II [Tamaricihabitans halophyticus]
MDPATLLRKAVRLYGENTAFASGERTQTYRELFDRAVRLTNTLRDAGISPGDRVAVLSDNAFESLEQIAGLALGNYVRCALYTHDTPDKHQYLLELTGSAALIVQDKHFAAVQPVLSDVPGLRLVLVVGDAPAGTVDYYQALAGASTVDPQVPLREDDPHIIRFSAGTTGKPKGILHTVRGWMDMGNEMALIVTRFGEQDRYLVPAPLSHAAGLFIWPLVAAGAGTIVMPAFEPAHFLELIERERASIVLVVPTMIQMITQHPDAATRDLSSLHTVLYGTAPASEGTLRAAIALWGNVMYQIYGQSEALPLTILAPVHHVVDGTEEQRKWLRSAGRPTPNSEIAILDDAGNQLPVGEIGEVAGRTPGQMSEIWGNPAATAERITEDGWHRTRDMGYLAEDGFLYLTDRKEDTIISGGFNIWPIELERALAEHPAVQESAVVGVPHPKWGETPHAAVVLRADCAATEEELIEWTKQRVGSVKKVTGVSFVESLPRSAIGKILRRVVREQCAPDASALHGA